MKAVSNPFIQSAQMLVARLERLSADSVWAHRASGMRGSLLRQLAIVDQPGDVISQTDQAFLEELIRAASKILENAAREIPDPSQSHSTLRRK